jgi:allophanate hydrolase
VPFSTLLSNAPARVAPLAPQAWISRVSSPLGLGAGGPLRGLGFAVKDNIDVAGLPTTAGCAEFAYRPTEHANVVQRLLDAGASLHGKTNLDQFACGLNGTRSPYGAVPNAFDAAYVSGGSSSGSAYVVATGQVDFSLGTDTAGSGRVPAGLNNIVGLKPSKGLISARGVVPAAQSVDCVSIFARSVSLAVQVLEAALGPDPEDPYSRLLQLASTPFPGAFRFGVPDRLEFHGDGLAQSAFDEAVARMCELGGTPVTIDFEPLAEAAALLYDSALVAERYAAVRDFFDAHEGQVIEPVRSILAGGRCYSAADLFEAQTRLRALGQQAAPMWEAIDLLLVPTAPTHYTIEQMHADPVVLNRNLGAYTNFVNLLDYAALSVPSAIRTDGLPFGITLIGACGSDWQLADLGQRYHHATGLTQGATGEALGPPRGPPGRGAPAAEADRRPEAGAHGAGGGGGRPPVWAAAELPADRTRRLPGEPGRDRARLPLLCPARHRPAQTRPAAGRRRQRGPDFAGGVGAAAGALRLLRRAGAAAAGDRHRSPGRRQRRPGFRLRAAGPRRRYRDYPLRWLARVPGIDPARRLTGDLFNLQEFS